MPKQSFDEAAVARLTTGASIDVHVDRRTVAHWVTVHMPTTPDRGAGVPRLDIPVNAHLMRGRRPGWSAGPEPFAECLAAHALTAWYPPGQSAADYTEAVRRILLANAARLQPLLDRVLVDAAALALVHGR